MRHICGVEQQQQGDQGVLDSASENDTRKEALSVNVFPGWRRMGSCLLRAVAANGNNLHGEIIFTWELSTGEEAKPLGPLRVNGTIAS